MDGRYHNYHNNANHPSPQMQQLTVTMAIKDWTKRLTGALTSSLQIQDSLAMDNDQFAGL